MCARLGTGQGWEDMQNPLGGGGVEQERGFAWQSWQQGAVQYRRPFLQI